MPHKIAKNLAERMRALSMKGLAKARRARKAEEAQARKHQRELAREAADRVYQSCLKNITEMATLGAPEAVSELSDSREKRRTCRAAARRLRKDGFSVKVGSRTNIYKDVDDHARADRIIILTITW